MIKQKIEDFRETIKDLEVEGYYGNRYDIEDALAEIDKIEQLILSDVSQRSELLLSYHRFLQEHLSLDLNEIWVKEYLKDSNCG